MMDFKPFKTSAPIIYLLSVPEKSVGSCGMTEIRDRSVFKSTVAVSVSSIDILPLIIAIRNMELINEDFPAPVRPTTLIFSFGLTENDNPFKTGSLPTEY